MTSCASNLRDYGNKYLWKKSASQMGTSRVGIDRSISVTILGHLLHFDQLYKVCGNNYLAQIAHILRQFLYRCKNLSFSSEIILGQLLQRFGNFLLVTLPALSTTVPQPLPSYFFCKLLNTKYLPPTCSNNINATTPAIVTISIATTSKSATSMT